MTFLSDTECAHLRDYPCYADSIAEVNTKGRETIRIRDTDAIDRGSIDLDAEQFD